MLKKYILSITILYSIGIALVSLIRIGDVPDYVPSFTDKVFHFLVYAVLTLFWYLTFIFKFKRKKSGSIIYAALISIVFGTIIEVLQSILTETRITDMNDLFANVSGVILTVGILILKNNLEVKKL